MSSIWLERLKAEKNQTSSKAVPTKPTEGGFVGFVGTPSGDIQFFDAHVECWSAWTERAAVFEFDGGVTRREAERLATIIVSGGAL